MRIHFFRKTIFVNVLFFLLMQSCAFGQGDAPTEAQVVCITRTGTKYHRCSCQYLRLSSIEIALTEAKNLGLDPCSVCKPSAQYKTIKSQLPEDTQSSNDEPISDDNKDHVSGSTVADDTEVVTDDAAGSGQCTAFTKQGARCKRHTRNTNGKCYQHQ